MKTSWHDKLVFKEIMNVTKTNMERACLTVERDAKIKCPVDTGRLRASMTHRLSTDSGRATISNPVNNEADDGIEAPKSNGSVIVGAVGTNVNYAPIVELGLGQVAQPYLHPALHQNEAKIKQILEGK